MINCDVSTLGALFAQLMLEEMCGDYDHFHSAAEIDVDQKIKEKIEKWLEIAEKVADDFELKPAHDRIKILRDRLSGRRGRMTNRLLATELRVLRETLDSGLKWQLIYRYPNKKSAVLIEWKKQWDLPLRRFPSAAGEIQAGVDLWALGHSTASVFHFMRVLEHGLRALAAELDKNFDVQNWQNILDQIEAEIRNLGKTLPAGKEKTDRLQFLSEAAKEFAFFKDGWRNHVSHGRGCYNNNQARSTMDHVCSFMTTLSSRLVEKSE